MSPPVSPLDPCARVPARRARGCFGVQATLQPAFNVPLPGAPWPPAPAAAIFAALLTVNQPVQGSGRAPVQLES